MHAYLNALSILGYTFNEVLLVRSVSGKRGRVELNGISVSFRFSTLSTLTTKSQIEILLK